MYHYKTLKKFTEKVFLKMGCSSVDAYQAADVLIKSELRGIPSHGLLRLPEYVSLWRKKRLNTNPQLTTIHETPSTALIDADSGLGLVTGPKAMHKAIEKANKAGTGWIAVRNSNHFGIAGYHAMLALEHDMIGICMTNANPLVAPTFSKERLLGTNPLAVAIPAGKETPFVADFATAPIARGKLDILKLENKSVPHLLVQDKNGHNSIDPGILPKGGAIMPLGGDRDHSSHKGYCMSAIVDILSAVLPGASFSAIVNPTLDFIPSAGKKDTSDKNGIGHFFGAIRIDAFQTAEEFKEDMDQWIRVFRSAKPIESESKVLIPGDPEREAEMHHKIHGLRLMDHVSDQLRSLSEELGIAFPGN